MYELIVYDTSNFENFPMGGQLSSIRNFLKYIAACHPDYAEKILLVGVTTEPEETGTVCTVEVDQTGFDFLPVLCRARDLSHVEKSLRLEYLKALLGRRGSFHCKPGAVHYIHTPEAYLAVKLRRPWSKTAAFSHGSFFNMVQGFRFYRKNKLVHWLFEGFLVLLLKTADLVFVLDEDTARQYRSYTGRICRAENAVVLPGTCPDRRECRSPVRLLYAGRLSRVKQIHRILLAMEHMENVHLTIVGDGEERDSLERLVSEKNLGTRVTMAGGSEPSRMEEYYRNADILIMNSQLEGKPMTILEAMSYGLPVVTTPVGGIPELVRSGLEGEFTDGSPRQIAQKVEWIKKDYDAYARRAAQRAFAFDHRCVNRRIFEKMMQIRKPD